MRCDGMDVVETYEVMREAIRRAREERQPILVEAITYRFRGHSMADPEEYRTKEQVAEWRKRDPITAVRRPASGSTRSEAEQLDDAAVKRVDEAVAVRRRLEVPAARVAVRPHLRDRRPGARAGTRSTSGRPACTGARTSARSPRPSAGRPTHYHEAVEAAGKEDVKPADEAQDEEDERMAVMRYREALNQALREEMQRDERVFLMGEDIGVFNGAFKVTAGLLEEFGEKRVRDTPISENTIVGMGVGAAMTGLRPVVELMTINFSLLAMDQIVNHMATIHYMFGGQAKVPMVVRMPQGAGHQLGPTHSHCLEALYLHVPGMLLAVPSTPADAKGLLKAAIRDDNPVVFIEHEYLYGQRGDVPDDDDHVVDFGQAAIRREGDDVTIVGISRMARDRARRRPTSSPRSTRSRPR